jgi:lysozyme family protein
MRTNFNEALLRVLKHEGGFVDHPQDPGGATNHGITIGALRQFGIDVDGDGDSDVVDLKSLRQEHLAKVYKLFYWDKVHGDDLPSGVDYSVFDFAVNSGPDRAIRHLQRAVGVSPDGQIGPKTLAAVKRVDPIIVIDRIRNSRMDFLKGLKTWLTFGKGWSRRVLEVAAASIVLATPAAPPRAPERPAESPHGGYGSSGAATPPSVPTPVRGGMWSLITRILPVVERKLKMKAPLVNQPTLEPSRKWWFGLMAGVLVNAAYGVLDQVFPGHPFNEFKADIIGWVTVAAMSASAYLARNRA